jgi:hypothetical protein
VIITRRYFNVLAATSAFMSSIAANRANALAWPTRPVHLVVPFAAGGPSDVIARIVGELVSKGWGGCVKRAQGLCGNVSKGASAQTKRGDGYISWCLDNYDNVVVSQCSRTRFLWSLRTFSPCL